MRAKERQKKNASVPRNKDGDSGADTGAIYIKQTAVNFGLINRTYDSDRLWNPHKQQLTQWQRFYHQVVDLNRQSPQTTQYKVLFLGRHGEGWHNAAESYYGTPAWNVST